MKYMVAHRDSPLGKTLIKGQSATTTWPSHGEYDNLTDAVMHVARIGSTLIIAKVTRSWWRWTLEIERGRLKLKPVWNIEPLWSN